MLLKIYFSKVFNNFHNSKKNQIYKAKRRNIFVKEDIVSPSDFYNMHKLELNSEKRKINYNVNLFLRIYDACIKHNKGKILTAIDAEKNIHGSLFVVWDNVSMYALISALNPKFLNSGASTLLFWEAIRFSRKVGLNVFDFEGSMIRSVEKSFNQFGGIQKTYFQIFKTNSKLLKIKQCLKDLLNL
jgi:lipid II:glycine glycyltransferase (peptidoglycan interpeptide bridge formation enzyme)